MYHTEYKSVTEITSSSNTSVKKWKSLLTARGIKKHNMAIVSGEKVVSEIISNKQEIIQECIISMKYPLSHSLIPSWLPVFRLKDELFRKLDVFGTRYPLLVVSIPQFATLNERMMRDGILLLVPFQDPANVGAVIRSAAAFGVRKIILLEEAATPFHPKSIRASGAQAFNVDFIRGPSIFELKNLKTPIVALSTDGVDISKFEFPDNFALLTGVEGPGLPDNLKPDFMISIPMEPSVESLNASVAVSIALYEWRKRTFSTSHQ